MIGGFELLGIKWKELLNNLKGIIRNINKLKELKG